MTRTRTTFISILILTLLAATLSSTTGCHRFKRIKDGEQTYRLAVDKTHDAYSEQVIAATVKAIEAMNLKVNAKNTTNVDGSFLVTTALGNEFRIIVQATSHTRTRIRIYTGEKPSTQMAKVIYENITSVM